MFLLLIIIFFFTSPYLQCNMFFELFLVTTITVLKTLTCYYMISFNFGGKKARDVDLTCRPYCAILCLIESPMILWNGGWLIFFIRGGNRSLPQHRRDGFSLFAITLMGVRETLTYKGLRQIRSIVFQWGFDSWACLRIPELEIYRRVLLLEYV